MNNKQTTKERLLESACIIFAEKGFDATTVAEICTRADANIAAVNYHFKNKENLYDEVWKEAFKIASTTYPIQDLPPDTPLEEFLFQFTHAILQRTFCPNAAGLFSKLLYREMASPTLALERILTQAIVPQSNFLNRAIYNEFGDAINEKQLRLCMHSIIGQCAFYNFSRPLRDRVIGKTQMAPDEIKEIAQHITNFSLGGLQATKKNIYPKV